MNWKITWTGGWLQSNVAMRIEGSICSKQWKLWVAVVYGRLYGVWGFRLKEFVWESSVEVRFFWEGATCSSDDDVGSVVCCLHTLIQWFLLDQLRQETCNTKENNLNRNPQKTEERQKATWKYIKWKQRTLLPPTKASPAPFVSTISSGSIFSTGNVSILSPEQTREGNVTSAVYF